MSDETNGQVATPAEGEQPEKTPVKEQAEYVTLADDVVEDDGESEDDEHESDKDGEGDEAGEEAGEKPKRKPGSARLKDRLRALERENEELRRPRQAPRAPAEDADDDLKEPKESDFPNDYLAYDRALRKYETQKAIREEHRRVAKSEAERSAETEHRTRLASYKVRLEDVKGRIPDFDKVMNDTGSAKIRNDVRDLILDSPKGPLLAYHLAKHPDKVAELNRMSPIAAAKELGSLEARIRGPQPKTVTKAKAPPAQTPKGGTATRAPDPAKMSMAEYRAAREAGKI